VTERFELFAEYPEDVWKKRLSACLAWLWEWGTKQLRRAEQRGDGFTAAMYWCRSAIYAMKVGFLLNRRYAPYHKWLHREFLKLPQIAPEVAPLLTRGLEQAEGKGRVASQIVEIYAQQIAHLGYRPAAASVEQRQDMAYSDSELLDYARAVHDSIQAPEISELRIRLEVLLPPWRPTWTPVFPS
jgi:hypothetical protein